MKTTNLIAAVAACLPCTFAVSNVHASDAINDEPNLYGFISSARFVESAPRDRFIISNESSAGWSIVAVAIDLSTSAGNLIFDTTAEGAGVEVFQPFRNDGGKANLEQEPQVSDGDQSINLRFSTFQAGEDFTFSIDIDDQLTSSDLGQIRVSNNEFIGTHLNLRIVNSEGSTHTLSGTFDDANRALLQNRAC